MRRAGDQHMRIQRLLGRFKNILLQKTDADSTAHRMQSTEEGADRPVHTSLHLATRARSLP
eukprot:6183193-Pleurochrysis_carterae.AAC.1